LALSPLQTPPECAAPFALQFDLDLPLMFSPSAWYQLSMEVPRPPVAPYTTRLTNAAIRAYSIRSWPHVWRSQRRRESRSRGKGKEYLAKMPLFCKANDDYRRDVLMTASPHTFAGTPWPRFFSY
jgi:hypothetical protein